MRILILVLMICLAACATAPHDLSRYPFSVPTNTGTQINADAYNREMDAQGFSYYCGNGACDKPPRFIQGRAPLYPISLQRAHKSGQATIVFTISTQGFATDFHVESTTGHECADAAIKALRTWRFAPATLQGKAVSVPAREQFPFIVH